MLDRCEAVSFLDFFPVPAGLFLYIGYYGTLTKSSVMQHFVAGLIHAAKMAEKCAINSSTILNVGLSLPETIEYAVILEQILELSDQFKEGANIGTKYAIEGFSYKRFQTDK